MAADSATVKTVPLLLSGVVDSGAGVVDSGAGCLRSLDGQAETPALTPLVERPSGDWACITHYSGRRILVDNRLNTTVRRLPQGLFDTLVRPLPWEMRSGIAMSLAGLEFILWAPLYGLAAYGVWVHRERYRLLMFPTLLVLAISLSGAVSHGNLGTAFRHRGQMLFALAVLAVGGVQGIVDSRIGKRRGNTVEAQHIGCG